MTLGDCVEHYKNIEADARHVKPRAMSRLVDRHSAGALRDDRLGVTLPPRRLCEPAEPVWQSTGDAVEDWRTFDPSI